MRKKLFRWAGLMMFMLVAGGDLRAQLPPEFVLTYTFGNDNAVPGSSLVRYCGELLGTSYSGGGNGTVYALTAQPNLTYGGKVVINFPGGNSGGSLYAPLTVVNENNGINSGIWGTTQNGGLAGGGILFYSMPDGSNLRTVYNFNSTTEGSQSQSTLWHFDVPNATGFEGITGSLTTGGSSTDSGALWTLITSNDFPIQYFTIHTFSKFDGAFPIGKLAYDYKLSAYDKPVANGVTTNAIPTFDLSPISIYGVTKNGGSNYGVVFSLNGNGSNFTVLHTFNFGTTDGYYPQGGLERMGSILYGTTSGGGSNYGGTIFQINTNGTGYKLLFNFGSASYPNSGVGPRGDLVLHRGTLYGTTYGGGTGGGGTVYSISTNGSNFTILHSFSGPVYNGNGGYTNIDGGYSVQGLLYDDNVLYGVTPYGGSNGVGVAYEIILPSKPRLQVAKTNGTFHIAWPSTAVGFSLQKNADLSTTNWSTNGITVVDDGTNKNVTISPAGGKSFFRLIQ